MRITNSSIARVSLAALQDNLQRVDEARQRATSGLRIRRPSDDPVGAASVLGADRGLRALEQYRRNIGSGRSRLQAEETGLGQLSDLLSRAREIALSQATSTADATSRSHVRAEADALIDAAIQLGNTRIDGVYLFGGAYPLERPFADDGSTSVDRPPVGSATTRIGSGQDAELNHDGQTVFNDTGAIAALQELRDALDAGDPTAIGAAASALTSAFDRVQTVLSEVGARTNRIDIAESNIEALEFNLKTLRSDLADADLETAITDLVNRQTTLQAAMAATSRMLSITLTDYLR